MPKEISGADLRALLPELSVLERARIDKFYQRQGELVVYAYKPGDQKYRLYLGAGKAFLTDYKRDMPKEPPSFCMYLRKQLSGKTIERVEQYDFDRILVLHTDEHVLICELFRNGNVIVTNKAGEVLNAMETGTYAGRDVYQGEEYAYPEPSPDPADVEADTLREHPEEDVVVVLAAECGLGGRYAEEVCARADVDKNAAVEALKEDDMDAVIGALHSLFATLEAGELEPAVYSDADGPVVATPVPFTTYGELERERHNTFSKALDTYYTEAEKAERTRAKRKAYEEQKAKLERRLEQQEHKLEGLKTAAEENQEKGELIYENYGLVEDILESVNAAREQHSEDEMEERLESEQAQHVPEAEAIQRLDLDNDAVVVDMGEEVRLDLSRGVEKNAEHYYEKGKQAKQKLPGVRKALKETRRELEELEQEEVEVEGKYENKAEKKRQKEWYEKFRWFRSSDGFLVIAGRDTTTNDMIVKKYMEPGDVYVHAEFTGAPSVVVRAEGDDVPESTLEEAGQFAVTFARSWKAGVTAEDAYYVSPDQVTQEAESGEYLPKGSFVIRGDRTYLNNLPVEAAIGAYKREDGWVAMGGPTPAVKEQCPHYVVLEQGREKPSDIAKTVQHHLHEETGGDFDLDAIIRALPPGKAAIREKH